MSTIRAALAYSPKGAGNPPSQVPIYEIQGREVLSPYGGQKVRTAGVVTAVGHNGFYLQDPAGDGDDHTSDAIFVFTKDAPIVQVGDAVEVSGTVKNRVRSGSHELPQTELVAKGPVSITSRGNPLPAPVRLGQGGRPLPRGSLQEGIPFWQSVEAMRVELYEAHAVSASNRYGEVYVVPDRGATLRANRTARGGARITHEDIHPEVVAVSTDRTLTGGDRPQANLGDTFERIEGVVSYDYGSYKVVATQAPVQRAGGVEREVTHLVGTERQLTIASFNVENLDPKVEDPSRTKRGKRDVDDDVGSGKLAKLARQIAHNLQAPDIVGLQEIQDNDGAEQTDCVDASATYQALIDAIRAAGGPTYAWVDLPPEDDADGGQPGGNIRVGFLYRPERVRLADDELQRIGEGSPAFAQTRKSLVARFRFRGQTVTVVNNHLSSKGGSSPLWGTQQPPIIGQQEQREKQATLVNQYVRKLQKRDPEAKVVVLGDFNDNEFSTPLLKARGNNLCNLTHKLPPEERYSYVFRGLSQQIDHMLVSNNLAQQAEVDIVHVNAEFAERASDHDPVVARLTFD